MPFENGNKVQLIDPIFTVATSNANHTECILADGTRVLIKAHLLKLSKTINKAAEFQYTDLKLLSIQKGLD